MENMPSTSSDEERGDITTLSEDLDISIRLQATMAALVVSSTNLEVVTPTIVLWDTMITSLAYRQPQAPQ